MSQTPLFLTLLLLFLPSSLITVLCLRLSGHNMFISEQTIGQTGRQTLSHWLSALLQVQVENILLTVSPDITVTLHCSHVTMIVIEEGQVGDRRKKDPEISLEWTDLRIEIKYCGNDVPEEDQDYVELYPVVSDKLLSSACIQEKLQEQRKKQKEAVEGRPSGRTGNTLSEILEQNQDVNQKRRSDGSSGLLSPEPQEEKQEVAESESKSQVSEESTEYPDSVDSLIDTKMLITLKDGSKKCHICGKVFNDSTRIKRHLLSHSDKKPYKCNLCGWGFHQKTNMERHLASHTSEGEGHPCYHCNSWFTTKSVLSLHLREAHGGRANVKPKVEEEAEQDLKPSPSPAPEKDQRVKAESDLAEDCDMSHLTCNICGKTFVKKTNLKHHLMLHRGEKPWKCHICGWRFVQKCNLKKHIETHNTGMYKCPHCDIKFASKGAVNGHLSLAHSNLTPSGPTGPNPPEEEEEAEIPEPEGILKRMMTGEGGGQYQAGSIVITPKTVPNIPQLSPPRVEISPSRTYVCPKCPKLFTSKKEFESHVLVHNSGLKKYACPVCGLRFHLLHNMKRHLLNHEEEGDIEQGTTDQLLEAAETTAAKFPQNSQPEERQVIFGGSGHLECEVCNKWFTDQISLQRHMEVHSDDRPYECPVCKWRFKQVHNMKRHLLTHSGAKPFSCDFCDKSYTDNYSLKQHVAKIHPDIASSLPHMMITPRNKSNKVLTAKRVRYSFN